MYADGTDGDLQGRGGYSGRGRRARRRRSPWSSASPGSPSPLTGVTVQLAAPAFHRGASNARSRRGRSCGAGRRYLPGQIFPASVPYLLSAQTLQDVAPLAKNALRVSISPQESDCAKAVTSAAAGAVLRRNGCEAVLRATYVDATRSYVMTVGVAVLPNAAAAVSADSGLIPSRLAAARAGRPRRSAAGGRPGDQVRRRGRWSLRLQQADIRSFAGRPVRRHVRRRVLRQPAAGAGFRRQLLRCRDDQHGRGRRGFRRAHARRRPAPPHCPGSPGC